MIFKPVCGDNLLCWTCGADATVELESGSLRCTRCNDQWICAGDAKLYNRDNESSVSMFSDDTVITCSYDALIDTSGADDREDVYSCPNTPVTQLRKPHKPANNTIVSECSLSPTVEVVHSPCTEPFSPVSPLVKNTDFEFEDMPPLVVDSTTDDEESTDDDDEPELMHNTSPEQNSNFRDGLRGQ